MAYSGSSELPGADIECQVGRKSHRGEEEHWQVVKNPIVRPHAGNELGPEGSGEPWEGFK